MNNAITRAELIGLLRTTLQNFPLDENLDDHLLLQDLGLDSIAMLSLLISAGETFCLDLAVLENIDRVPTTVGELHAFLSNLPKENYETAQAARS
jgi:acyl carrier protein